jgi:tRNA pseudouridine55 synthase
MPKNIHNIYKPLGLTPLQALEKFKKQAGLPKEYKMTYAGRLDPLAEGVLILLSGKKLKEKDKFLKFNKTYRAQILFGVATDTFDLMGKITKVDYRLPEIHEIKKEIKKLVGRTVLPIPPYSSVPINGRPSFMYARAGELGLDNINSREMNITKITLSTCKKISADKVLKSAQEKISKVSGDFRQKEILKLWNKKLKAMVAKFLVVDVVISCASGTYIRSIAQQLGKQLNCGGLLFNLKRSSVGKFKAKNAIRLKK